MDEPKTKEFKEDCFAFKKSGEGHFKCKALDVKDCTKCGFYKPKEEVNLKAIEL